MKPTFTKARIGDRIVFEDTRSGTTVDVEVVAIDPCGNVQVAITAPRHIDLTHEHAPVDDPLPGSVDTPSAAQLDMRDRHGEAVTA